MGSRDAFTSVKQLKNNLNSAAGCNEIRLIERVCHFEMEGPAYDAQMANLIREFIASFWDMQPVLRLAFDELLGYLIPQGPTKPQWLNLTQAPFKTSYWHRPIPPSK